ncbi:MAG: IS481 family transposase [Acidimicrobiaceae bacterium]|nr:IS481 family transposase [Acidimicrobiaceae bacterium]
MGQTRIQHANAALNANTRRRMVDSMLTEGLSAAAAARQFRVDPKTARKWRDRFLAEGDAGLNDRPSTPHHSPNRTNEAKQAEVLNLRSSQRRCAAAIANQVGLACSTVQKILNSHGMGRLNKQEHATRPTTRYVHDKPGDLVHVDIKKLVTIREHGEDTGARAAHLHIHTAVDDHSRLAYSEILTDETGQTAAAFWRRANTWFAKRGLDIAAVLTDNGSCYRSQQWATALEHTAVDHKRTRPYNPQTNGKVERFHRTLLNEWANIQPWTSEQQRTNAYPEFMHYYNNRRTHMGLNWATPASKIGHNLCEQYSRGGRARCPQPRTEP